jgi:hypothetical protein
VKCFRATMYSESGVQAGPFRRRKLSFVTACGFEPSRSMTQMLSPPERSLVKAIQRPSGEKRGCMFHVIPSVSCVAVPPSKGIV